MNRELLIGDVFRGAARAFPHRPAVALSEAELTYQELNVAANRSARAMMKLGVEKGDRLVVWASTSLDVVPVFVAASKLGAVFAPMDAGLSVEEAVRMAGTVRPRLLLVDAERSQPGSEVAARVGATCVMITGLAGALTGAKPGVAPPSLAVLAASEESSDFEVPRLKESDPHVIFFTSGTTGCPKGVVISHRVSYLRTHPGALLEPRGSLVCPYPLFHMGAWTLALQQWQARDLLVLLPEFDAATLCAAIRRHRAARINAIPAIWRRILDHVSTIGEDDVDLSSIRVADTGTSATPPDLLEAIRRALPKANLRVFYGSTEAGPVAMLEDKDISRKPGSCGVTVATADVRFDPAGEVLVRGPLMFEGYFEDPDATASAFVDGWYRTGDLADVDDEGYLTIVGRARDIIRTGGESVAPLEVEQVLAAHDAVSDVAVVGVPDDQWGEVVCAVIVPAHRHDPPTLDGLRIYCDGRIARFKQPRRLVLVESIPRTASTNQLQRRLLLEQLRL